MANAKNTLAPSALQVSRVRKEMAGKRFGRWQVVKYAGKKKWHCRCDCGTTRPVIGSALRSGVSVSCGCLRHENAMAAVVTHGMYKTSIYKTWNAMKQRCNNPNHKAYKNYGGRGISVCREWSESFEAFYRDMGPRPRGRCLDRIDNNGNYEPGNCRWATKIEQENNKRNNRFITFRGVTLSVAAWERRLEMARNTLAGRLFDGWSVDRAITQPVQEKRSAKHVHN